MDTPIVPNNGRFQKDDKRINRNGRPSNGFVNAKDYKLSYRYGIRLSEYESMFETQRGVCAICGQPETMKQARSRNSVKTPSSLHVDHDHETGEVRGLICWKCNVGIVKLLDNRDLVESAAKYLGIKVEYSKRD